MKKVAIAGFGFMGMTHALNVLKNKDLLLVAIVDTKLDAIKNELHSNAGNFSTGNLDAESLKDVRMYKSLDECLREEELDACIISVHTDLHYKLTKMALEAGVNVFLEKPFCIDPEEGQELMEISEKNGLLLMVGQVVRFMPAYQKLKDWIDSGVHGKLTFLSLSRFSGLPDWGQWKEKQAAYGTSGGALFDLVIHDIDFARWIFGEPDEVNSICMPGKLSDQDYITANWEYHKKDIHIKIEGGNVFHSAFPFYAGFLAYFENASARFPGKDNEHLTLANDFVAQDIRIGNPNEGFRVEMDYFTECLLDGRFPEKCSPETALQTIRLCHRHIKREESLS